MSSTSGSEMEDYVFRTEKRESSSSELKDEPKKQVVKHSEEESDSESSQDSSSEASKTDEKSSNSEPETTKDKEDNSGEKSEHTAGAVTTNSAEGDTKNTEEEKPITKKSSWTEPWPESPVGLSKRQLAFIILGLMLSLFLASLDSTIVSTALPAIVSDFGRLDLYSWVVISYLLTSTTVMPLSGKLSDIFGRKIVYMGSIVVFLIGSALCGASPNMISLIVFRAFQGIGGGALVSLTLVIIGDVVSVRQRGRFAGVFGVCFALASVIGPVIGGVITDNATWRWIFYINLPIGVVALIVLWFTLRLPTDKIKLERALFASIDYIGALLLVVGIVCILLAASFGGNQYPWDHPAIIVLFVVGGLILIGWGFWELKPSSPIINLRTMILRNVGLSNLVSFTFGWAMFGGLTYLPIYFQVVRGDSPTISGLKLLPLMFGLVLFSMVSGATITKFGYYYHWPIVGGFILILSLGLIGGLLTVDYSIGWLSFFVFLYGAGIGCVIQTLAVIVQSVVERKEMATATTTIAFVRTMGGVLGVTVFGAILNNKLAQTIDPQFLPLVQAGHEVIVNNLPPMISSDIFVKYTAALRLMFLAAIPVVGVGLILAFIITNKKIEPMAGGKKPEPILDV